MNLFRAAIFSVSLWTSLTLVGDGISAKTFIEVRLASIPLYVTMYPWKLPDDTPKVYFEGLRFI